jgi:hypothetical protein
MSDVAVLLQSAREALARGEHGQALPLLQEAVRLAPGNFEVHMYLGVYLGVAGQHVEGCGNSTAQPNSSPTARMFATTWESPASWQVGLRKRRSSLRLR